MANVSSNIPDGVTTATQIITSSTANTTICFSESHSPIDGINGPCIDNIVVVLASKTLITIFFSLEANEVEGTLKIKGKY